MPCRFCTIAVEEHEDAGTPCATRGWRHGLDQVDVVHGDTGTETLAGENTGNLATSDGEASTAGTTKGEDHSNIQPSLGVYVIIKAL